MKVKQYGSFFFIVFLRFLLSLSAFGIAMLTPLQAQTAAGALRGQVTDPSGAVISGASVIMTPAAGSPIVVQSDAQGACMTSRLYRPASTRSPSPLRDSLSTKTTMS
jgi:hypothetical protein